MNGPEHYREAERLLAGAMKHRVDSAGDWKDGDVESHKVADALVAEAQVHATLALAAAHGIEEPPVSERRPRTRITDNHLIAVANVYTDADDAGGAPTRAVADRFDVPHSTAAKWVGRARKQGLLPAAEGGAA